MLGQLLDRRYQVIQPLGAGGFGQTYIAQDTRRPGNPICVVKHLKPASTDPRMFDTAKRLFNSEAETLEQLGNHDQIPRLLAYFDENQEFYLVQEFIEGHPLSAELQPGQRWTESQVIEMLQEVLSILDFVHRQSVIHRDIKPDNIIRRHRDNRLVLVDFGAVKQLRVQLVNAQAQPTATVAIGTPGYMPTEQAQGKPRPNSDIYALGVIAIQALTGLMPMEFQEDPNTGELLFSHLVPFNPKLASVLTKMVRYHFKDRYQTATEALQDLQQLSLPWTPVQPAAAPDLEHPEHPANYATKPGYTPPQPPPLATPPQTTSWQHTTPVAPANVPAPPAYQNRQSAGSGSGNLLPLLIGAGLTAVFVAAAAIGSRLALTDSGTKVVSNTTTSPKGCFAVLSARSNIRSEPYKDPANPENNVVQKLPQDTKLLVTGRKTAGGWIEVIAQNRPGWANLGIIANDAEIESCLKASGTPIQTVADDTLITSRQRTNTTPGTDTNSSSRQVARQPTPRTDTNSSGGQVGRQPTPEDDGPRTLAQAKEKYQSGDLDAAIALLRSIPATSSVFKQAEDATREWQQNWANAEAKLNAIKKALDEGRWDEVLKYQQDNDFPEIRYWRDKLTPLIKEAIQKKLQPPSPSPSATDSPIPTDSPTPIDSPTPTDNRQN